MQNSCIIVACFFCLFGLSTQAQESNAQKMLLNSIECDKLDIAGVRTALDKEANPNYISDTASKRSVLGSLAWVTLFHTKKDEKAEEKSNR